MKLAEAIQLNDELPFEDELMNPTLDALRQRDGRATPAQIRQYVINALNIGDAAAQFRTGKSNELGKRLTRVRADLKRYGVIDNRKRGVWALTALGRSVRCVDPQDVFDYVFLQNKFWVSGRAIGGILRTHNSGNQDLDRLLEDLGVDLPYETRYRNAEYHANDWKRILHTSLSAMSPKAFEHLIVRLLLEYSNMDDVEVTDRTRDDGGLHGFATLRHADAGSVRAPFQFKRFGGRVSLNDVLELRGKMTAEDSGVGIILTTRDFMRNARNEAQREPRIVMINGDTLFEQLRRLGWGISSGGEVVDVSTYYFDNYHLFYSMD